MHVQLISDDKQLPLIVEVLLALRPQYDAKSLTSQIKKQQQSGYHIAFVSDDKQVLSVAGFVFGEKLAWGKYLYVDDLVTRDEYHGEGAGTLLLNWLKQHAKENACEQLHLDSGVQRFAAHRFYLKADFNIASHHFSLSNL